MSSNEVSLPTLIDRAAQALVGARTSAEVIDAKEKATVAYDAARLAARLLKMKGAHDTLVAAAHRAQADALEIEAGAKRRLADEYDAAQKRGEVRTQRDNQAFSKKEKASGPELVPPKELHEARIIRDAEKAEPGIVRRTVDEALSKGEAPTRAKVKRAVKAKSKRKRHPRLDTNDPTESQHDRDLQMLLSVWGAACESAREEFLKTVSI